MHIFIDESGTFSGLGGASSAPSVVGALVICDSRLSALEADYLRLRARLPTDKGEVKGRQLGEAAVAEVLRLLYRHDAVFEATAIDPGMHTSEAVEDHRSRQAAGITKNLTDQHHPTVHSESWRLRHELEAMSLQLYLQSVAMFELVHRTMTRASLYWVQRRPAELGAFHWVLDAKHAAEPLTPWETWWLTCVLPILQAKSNREPMAHLEGADYSHFERFLTDWMPWAFPDRAPPDDGKVIDLRLLLTEHFRFSPEIEPGLELVDIATTAVRRALRGSLRPAGWADLPKLMIHERSQYVQLIAIGDAADTSTATLRYRRALAQMGRGGRSMVAK